MRAARGRARARGARARGRFSFLSSIRPATVPRTVARLRLRRTGRASLAKIKKKREASISQFKKTEKDIFEKEKKLISQKNILSNEEFEKKLKDLRNDISNYQKDRNKALSDIRQSRVKASTNLIKKIAPILEAYSKEKSIRIIIQKKQIVMGNKEDDITKDILELVNKKIKSVKID